MSVINIPPHAVPASELVSHINRVRDYLRSASDPNETGYQGQTCVSLALAFCSDKDGVAMLRSLLEKGGDPNRPSSVQNFIRYLSAAKTTEPLALMIEAGLDVNQVCTATPGEPFEDEGPFTMLDYVLKIHEYLNRKRKTLSGLAKKYAGGGLTPRRRFIDDTIAVLESHGAKSASDVGCSPT